ncbi:hypothetical protein KAR91_56940 [Candidatus Pacearchaeota archaeon]|nr:hypothetical protein [Candidatus Pacearchaeota archaeon]
MTDYGRYVAIHKEGSLGSDEFTGSIASFDYFDVLSEGFSEDNQIQIVEAVSRERRRFALGGFAVTGDMQVAIDMNTIGRLLYGVLGNTVYAATGEHLFWPSEDLPTFNVERGFGGTFVNNALRYIKSVENSLSLEFTAGSNPTANVNWQGGAKTAGFLTTAQTLSAVQGRWGIKGGDKDDDLIPGAHFVNVAVAGAELTNVEAMTIEINNNMDPVTRLGSRHINRVKPQARTVTGTLDVSFDDDDLYQRFLDGTTSSTAPGTSYTPFQMEVAIAVSATQILYMDMPEVVFTTPGGPNLSGSDRKKMSIAWQAFYGTPVDTQVVDLWGLRTNLPDSGDWSTTFTGEPTSYELLAWLENDVQVIYSTQ